MCHESSEPELLAYCRNIKFLRETNGLSLTKMAEIMKIDVRTLRRVEADIVPKRFGSGALLRLAAYFHLKPSELFSPLSGAGQGD